MVFDISAFKGKYNPAIGTIIQFSNNNPNNIDPSNSSIEQWKLCNGQSLSKTNYLELYSILGDTYGSTSNMFNLPDYRGKLIVGNGPIDGLDTQFIGNLSTIEVGIVGGAWEVNGNDLDPNNYISIGDYEISAWEDLTTTTSTSIEGSWSMEFGPLEDVAIRGVPEHSHSILACEVNDQQNVYPQSNAIDPFAVCYTNTRATMEQFEPSGGNLLSHSHNIKKISEANPNDYTSGNTIGRGSGSGSPNLSYTFSANALEFTSSPVQVQMNRLNSINIRHTLSSNFKTFSLQNKYKRVYYWIKVI